MHTGTHYVQNITINHDSITPGQVTVSGDLISSGLQGFFVIAYTQYYHEGVHYGVASYRSGDRDTARVSLTLDLPGRANYSFFVFGINETGLPLPRSANVVQTVSSTIGYGNNKGMRAS